MQKSGLCSLYGTMLSFEDMIVGQWCKQLGVLYSTHLPLNLLRRELMREERQRLPGCPLAARGKHQQQSLKHFE